MAKRTNSPESCTSFSASSLLDRPSRPASAPTTTYRGLSPETKSLARQVFNSENDTQADSSSVYDCSMDWLLNAIAESEKLDTTSLRRGSLAENVKAAHVMYKDMKKDCGQKKNNDMRSLKPKTNTSADALDDIWKSTS